MSEYMNLSIMAKSAENVINQLETAAITIVLLILILAPIIINEIKKQNKNNEWQSKQIFMQPQYNWKNANYNQPLNQKQYLPYRLITPILSQREKTAYYIIKEYCNSHNLELFSKIRIADFITPKFTNQNQEFYTWFNKISAKHVDFLIVQQGTFRPLLAIEIDDTTHYRPDRQQRDELINNIYYSVGLPIYHCWNLQKETMISEIENTLKAIIQ